MGTPDGDMPAEVSFSKGKRWVSRWVRIGWLVVGLLWALPIIVVVGAGWWWLWQAGWLWKWLGLTGAVSFVAWLLAQCLRQASRDTWSILVQPDPRWTAWDQAAWEKVEALAVRLQQSDLPLDQPEGVLQAFYEVLATVARHYRPDSDRPELEIPAPHVLRIIERVAADLRRTLVERVPGSHWLTLHDFYKLSRLAAWFQRFYRWFYGAYRVTQLATNPAAALVREVRDAALGQLQASTSQELKEGVISFCVRQAGRYAIQLYSGKVLLEGDFDRLPPTRQTLREIQKSSSGKGVEEEPIRILILGGTGSGKALVVQMLGGLASLPKPTFWNWKKWFGGPSPVRRLCHLDGLPPLLVTDWPEYDFQPPSAKLLASLQTELLQTDLVLLVCAPVPGQWSVDRQWLEPVQRMYQEHPDRNPPAILVVLGRQEPTVPIPSEANPAFAGHRSEGLLLTQLRSCLALADTTPAILLPLTPLQLPEAKGKLLDSLRQLLPEADRARYARYYAQYHSQQRWPRLWNQLRHAAPQAGKLAAQQAPTLIKQASQTLWQLGTRWLRKHK